MKQSSSETANNSKEWFFRFTLQSCQACARGLVLLAGLVLFLARPLPHPLKERFQSGTRLLKNVSILIVEPSYIRRSMQSGVILRSMLDGLLLGALFGFAGAYYVSDERLLFILLIPFLLLLIALVNFLTISGDLYLTRQDEFQRAVFNEASAYTLKVTVGLLVLLLLSYLFFRAWRSDVAVHLSIVLFLARMIYMIKLVQLRWSEMVNTDLENSVEGYMG